MNVAAFIPNYTKTKSISASSTTASVTLDATDVSSTPTPANAGPSGGHESVRITNTGPNVAFVRITTGASSALATDMPILAGTVEMFTKPLAADTVSAICASTQTATLYITCGDGQ